MSKKAIVFSIYSILILLLIILPIVNKESALNRTYVLNIRGDYLIHSFIFLPWCFFKPVKSFNMNEYLWLILGLFFAVGLEAVQLIIPYRTFNQNDAIGNTAGVLLGYLVIRLKLLKK